MLRFGLAALRFYLRFDLAGAVLVGGIHDPDTSEDHEDLTEAHQSGDEGDGDSGPELLLLQGKRGLLVGYCCGFELRHGVSPFLPSGAGCWP